MTKGRLFYKVFFAFLIVSLVPFILSGYYIVNMSAGLLLSSKIEDQKKVARAVANSVSAQLAGYKSLLSELTAGSLFKSIYSADKRSAVRKLMSAYPEILEVSVADMNGMEYIRENRFSDIAQLRNVYRDEFFEQSVLKGDFLGGFEKIKGQYPAIIVAIKHLNKFGFADGVCSAKISLTKISAQLSSQFLPQNDELAAIITGDGFVSAHSDLAVVFGRDASLPKSALNMIFAAADLDGGGKIYLPGKGTVIGAFAQLAGSDWTAYIEEPISSISTGIKDVRHKVWSVLGIVIIFAAVLSYIGTYMLVYPIMRLKRAANAVARGDFDGVERFKPSSDELGELVHSFYDMSDNLKIKTEELLGAKEELEKFNTTLEARVEARTRELKTAQEELIEKERLASIGRMSSIVSHEIRNPLAVISNSSYFIKQRLQKDSYSEEKVVKHLSIIDSEIGQANSIIDEILSFARTRELVKKSHNIIAYITQLLDTFPFPSHIQVIRKFGEDARLNLDSDQMNQALRNILKNAIEVMTERGAITVAVRRNPDNTVELKMSDTGPGMDKETLSKIFTPFFTTKARGTGLGLAIVKKVITAHNGRVQIESELGKGTAFKITLPADPAWKLEADAQMGDIDTFRP